MNEKDYWVILCQAAQTSNVPAETLFALSTWGSQPQIVETARAAGIANETVNRHIAFVYHLKMELSGGQMAQIYARLYCDAISIAKLQNDPTAVPQRAMLAQIDEQARVITEQLQQLAQQIGCEVSELPERVAQKNPELGAKLVNMLAVLAERDQLMELVRQSSAEHGVQMAKDMLEFKAQYRDPRFWIRRALNLQVTTPLDFGNIEAQVEAFFTLPHHRSKVILVGTRT